MLKIVKINTLIFLIITTISFAQKHGTGLILGNYIKEKTNTAPNLTRELYENLPSSYSLKKYCPVPGDQGVLSTCCGWAISFSARTILESIKYNYTGEQIDSSTFSPSFIYNQIRQEPNCKSGTDLLEGIKLLKNEGTLKFSDFLYDCNRKVTESDKLKAAKFKIKEYRELAYSQTKNKVLLVKKSISENNPVIIAMKCPNSFQFVKDVWNPKVGDLKNYSGGHALTIIGYDDNKYGGSFEIINSWGTNWGEGGFAWIRYTDFNDFCVYACEIIGEPSTKSEVPDFSGSLQFHLRNGDIMNLEKDGNNFKMKSSYKSHTDFNLIFTNEEPAYVYAIGSDLSNQFNRIFPINDNTSAYFPYKKNNIILPAEGYTYRLDDTEGKTYFWFIYSKQKINLDSLINNIENIKGNIKQRIKKILGTHLVNNVKSSIEKDGEMKFSANSKGKPYLSILVEIPHKKGR